MPNNQPCIHPQLQWCGLTEKQERGDIGAWYECQRCGERFRTDLTPYKQPLPMKKVEAIHNAK